MSAITVTKKKLSVKTQTLAAVTAIAAAVVLPQLLHVMGAMSGIGTALGEIFLPMHLPILFVGLLAGPYAGAIAGLFSPLLSHALTSMPTGAMLPFMMIELCVYGLIGGLLHEVKLPSLVKVFVAQIAGRAVRAVAILIAVYGFASDAVPVSVIWKSVETGIFGLVLQWVFLPLLLYRVQNGKRDDT